MKYSNDAWKNWKSNNIWHSPGLTVEIENLILNYVKAKSIWWIKSTCLVRESIIKGISFDKSTIKKNLGRMTRLWFKAEQTRQGNYLKNGPYFSETNMLFVEEIFSCWIKLSQFQRITFPSFQNRWDLKLLILGLERIKKINLFSKIEGKTNSLEQNLMQNAMRNPFNTFLGIFESIKT